ncbi:unnamed protein product [Diamesa hyperborea]
MKLIEENEVLFKLSEVALRNGKDTNEVWIVMRDSVYNVTEYLEHHPGGKALIMEFAGKDATKDFDDSGHSSDAYKMLKKFKIGELIEEDRKCNRKNVLQSISPEPSVKSLDIKKKRKRRVLLFCG